ncbi:unnamed protein product, partial [Mesorhabditis belari]|uniref:Uncharacterized protein n=1 Tax=Mesorhabditis belari TaxID=2138241 RepID=A0AAF3FQC9_9BILA
MAADIVPVTTSTTPITTTTHEESQEEIVEITVTDEAITEDSFSSSASPGFQMPQIPQGFAADMANPMFTPTSS